MATATGKKASRYTFTKFDSFMKNAPITPKATPAAANSGLSAGGSAAPSGTNTATSTPIRLPNISFAAAAGGVGAATGGTAPPARTAPSADEKRDDLRSMLAFRRRSKTEGQLNMVLFKASGAVSASAGSQRTSDSDGGADAAAEKAGRSGGGSANTSPPLKGHTGAGSLFGGGMTPPQALFLTPVNSDSPAATVQTLASRSLDRVVSDLARKDSSSPPPQRSAAQALSVGTASPSHQNRQQLLSPTNTRPVFLRIASSSSGSGGLQAQAEVLRPPLTRMW
jgi:hypothetical protein